MRRRGVRGAVAAIGAIVVLLGAAAALAASSDGSSGSFSCPDPNVTAIPHGRYRYYLVCTSDQAPASFPIRGSNDLEHWRFIAFVFAPGRQPGWALAPASGHFWAPALYWIDGRWTVYFAAALNTARLTLPDAGGAPHESGEMAIGVATARGLSGPWRTRILHYRGQFDATDPDREVTGGVIDPSVVHDPSGRLYLYWSLQQGSLWGAPLATDGLGLSSGPSVLYRVRPGWECGYAEHRCIVEAPSGFYRAHRFYLFYSGASTWDESYAEGVLRSNAPLSGFRRLSAQPLLSTAPGRLGPGGASQPVLGPTGQSYLFYHSLRAPDPLQIAALRYLFRSRLAWGGPDGGDPSVVGPSQPQVALGTDAHPAGS